MSSELNPVPRWDPDPVTGVNAPPALHPALSASVQCAANGGPAFALLRLDIAGFHQIQECFGDDFANRILKSVADWLCSILVEDGWIARSGHNEFTLILPLGNAFDAGSTHAFVERLRAESAMRSVDMNGVQFRCLLTIVYGIYSDDIPSTDHLLRRFSRALRFAKSEAGAGTVREVSSDRDEEAELDRAALEGLWQALHESNNLDIAYQAQSCPQTGEVLGIEALLRVNDGSGGPTVPTDRVVALAEQNGLIGRLDSWVVAKVVHTASGFVASNRCRRVAVNVSPLTLDPGFVNVVRGALDASGFPPSCLELEVTETGMVTSSDTPLRVEVLQELTDLGLSIMVDDVGTGYAGLSRLRGIPAVGFKVDRSVLSDHGLWRADTELLELLAATARALNLTVVLEGVESAAHLETARRLRYGRVQGWYLARPVPWAAFREFLQLDCASSK